MKRGTKVEHLDFPGEVGTVLGEVGPIGGYPAVVVQWRGPSRAPTDESTATWTHKLSEVHPDDAR